ncbi:MAG: hypothetical protein GY822_25990 [Deltaproteobacteria bacterium]|nr:hypothetical protein [Deltaproteobacteria bacterium]
MTQTSLGHWRSLGYGSYDGSVYLGGPIGSNVELSALTGGNYSADGVVNFWL